MATISIVTGLYGSGKSEFSIQYAIHCAKTNNKKVYIADLDVVNVYFRSREKSELLKQYNINILGNVLGNDVNTDVPHLSANFATVIKEDAHIIVDLAGSEAGLKMIGAFIEDLVKKNNGEYEFILVYNMYRGLTDVNKIRNWIEYINSISDLKVTSIVNNSHLMEYTTFEDIVMSQETLEQATDLNILYTMVDKNVLIKKNKLKNVFEMPEIYLRKEWD